MLFVMEEYDPKRTRATTAPPATQEKSGGKKRKRRDADISNSPYFKLLVIVQQLRPYFIEVLKTPDFRNCNATHEIRKRMKLVMDLYKQMQVGGTKLEKFEAQPFSSEKAQAKDSVTTMHTQQEKTEPEHIDPAKAESVPIKTSEKLQSSHSIAPVKRVDDERPQGTYIVGGSVGCHNFITFLNRHLSVYYGETKESYRRRHSKSEYSGGGMPGESVKD